MKVHAWYVNPNGIIYIYIYIVKQPYPSGNQKCEILIIETQMVSKEQNTGPTVM